MDKNDVSRYEGCDVKIILKGNGNVYHGKILHVGEASFVILDRYNKEVTVDYEVCGVIVPEVES